MASESQPAPSGRPFAGAWLGTLWLLLVTIAVLAPAVASSGEKEPFGRPWYLGRLLVLSAILALNLLALRQRRSSPSQEPAMRRLAGIFVFLVAYTSFVANYETLSAGDNLPSRAIPRAILAGEGFDLSQVLPARLHGNYSVHATDDGLYSSFPVGTGLLSTPYLALVKALGGTIDEVDGPRAARLEKHAASLLSAFGILFVFLASERILASIAVRSALALALATGTPILSSLSQALWSQTGEFFLLALAIYLVSRRARHRTADLAAGVAAGLAILCRPTAALFAPVVWLFGLRPLRQAAFFVIGLTIGGGASLAINLRISGHPLGAYMRLNSGQGVWHLAGFWERFAGVTISPSRGLVWFFPALLVAVAMLSVAHRRLTPVQRRLAFGCIASIAAIVTLTATYMNWWGGYSVGPRLLAEIAVPAFAIWALAIQSSPRAGRILVVVLLLLQSVVHLRIYDFKRARDWNGIVDVDRGSPALFSLRNSLLAAAFVPHWQYEAPLEGYFLPPRQRIKPASWRPVDLSRVANADYSDWQAEGSPTESTRHLYLPRIGLENYRLSERAGFSLLPPHRPNMIRLCAGESATLELAGIAPFRQLAAVLCWRGSEHPAGPIGALALTRENGAVEKRSLRLGVEVFDPATALAPPKSRIIAGRWNDFDELARTELGFPHRTAYSALELTGPEFGTPGCLYVLAISVR